MKEENSNAAVMEVAVLLMTLCDVGAMLVRRVSQTTGDVSNDVAGITHNNIALQSLILHSVKEKLLNQDNLGVKG